MNTQDLCITFQFFSKYYIFEKFIMRNTKKNPHAPNFLRTTFAAASTYLFNPELSYTTY